ncbi:uncharacterized protein LOC122532679 isoform X1 [Frieseomelitta varia]|uniref:uncharacterized protein LOC122532679 isoform X1 n=2 Tax=Frieseomelitta varia TaxID=561572 RepID=UPI001CB6A982|nr:uncharacterized protein LOC122532679 isoform X1 [Frieseomelitta varia]
MLRCTILVLQLFGLLATCCSTVLYRNTHSELSIAPADCSQSENSTECATKNVRDIEGRSNEAASAKEVKMIRLKELENNDVAVEEGRRKKNKGYGQMLMYFLGASKLTMLYVLVNAVAAIAGKALIVGKVALAIATAIALKKAFEHKEKVSYEIIKHPYHSSEHSYSTGIEYDHHGGYGENNFNYRKRRRILH